jgi:hypothetical protein
MTLQRLGILFVFWLIGLPFVQAENTNLVTQSQPDGLIVSMTSELTPLAINQMHSWVINLQNSAGDGISDASIRVDGGMPAHNHGLATRPQVTSYPGEGNYLLEGMRFHMHGEWELRLIIEHAGREYRAVLKLQL